MSDYIERYLREFSTALIDRAVAHRELAVCNDIMATVLSAMAPKGLSEPNDAAAKLDRICAKVERIRERAERSIMEARSAITAIGSQSIEGWQPMETSPHAMHFLAAYYDDSIGEWEVGIVMRGQNINDPWTHWTPLPELPLAKDEERHA